jgi:hypothetical protein
MPQVILVEVELQELIVLQTGTNGLTASSGGSGVVILSMPTANYSGTTTGSPTVTTDGTDTILVFNASGSYTG